MSKNQVAPTTKYTTYLREVEQALAGRLSRRERRRLEAEHGLLLRARFLKVNGITHHYQDEGPRHGQPIVLVHGWDCSAMWWHHVVGPLVSAGYRVILYDLKGHGFSDTDPARNYTVQSFSDDLLALTQALHLPTHHIVAFSLGAAVALHYAAHQPERVRSLAFFNFGIFPANPVLMFLVPMLLDMVFNKLLRPITQRGLWILPFIYARLFLAKNTPLVSDTRIGTLGVRLCDPEAVRISAKQLANRKVLESILYQMERIKQPVLVVAGEGDPVVRPKNSRKLVEVAPDGMFIEVPRCGHIILFELPEFVVQILYQHLRVVACSKDKES
jgi:pimeloyl-ACP methyl ester carboxylesterase